MRSLLRFHDDHKTSTNLQDLTPNKRLDVETLAAYLCQTSPSPTSRTIYEGVRNELLPNTWTLGVETSDLASTPSSLSEAYSQTRVMVERVLEKSIGSAKRVAVLVSGGIDSSIVMTIAMEIMARRGGTAFGVTSEFASPGDDRPHLRVLEEHLHCEIIRIGVGEGARHLDAVRHGLDGAPMLWPFSPLQLALFEQAREHGAECLLTGVGGDDFFDGDPRSLAELTRRHPAEAIRRARSIEGFWLEPRFPAFEYLVRPALARCTPRAWRRASARRSRSPHLTAPWAGPELRRAADEIADRSLEHTLTHSHAKAPTEDYFDWPGQQYFAWLIHQEQRGGLVDRFDPLLTEDIAAMIRRFPAHYLIVGNRRRGLLREAMRGKVPDSILDRTDKAEFAPAFPTFLEAVDLQKTFGEELEGRSLNRLGIVNGNAFRREITRALEEPEQTGAYGLAWAALAAEAFLLSHPQLV